MCSFSIRNCYFHYPTLLHYYIIIIYYYSHFFYAITLCYKLVDSQVRSRPVRQMSAKLKRKSEHSKYRLISFLIPLLMTTRIKYFLESNTTLSSHLGTISCIYISYMFNHTECVLCPSCVCHAVTVRYTCSPMHTAPITAAAYVPSVPANDNDKSTEPDTVWLPEYSMRWCQKLR